MHLKTSKITGLDFIEDLNSRYARRRFLSSFALIAMATALGAYALAPYSDTFRELGYSLMLQIFANCIVILIFYCLYVFYIGPNHNHEVSVTRPQDISGQLETLTLSTKYYAFWGRSGSYLRATPLPTLDKRAKAEKENIDIEILLPDPMDKRLVDSYNKIMIALGEPKDDRKLLSNFLATCITCAIMSANNKFIRFKIFKSSFLPAFRVDLSEDGACLTQDDKKKSALTFQRGSEFHEMLKTTLRNEMMASTEVKWDEKTFEGLELDAKSCDLKTLTAFGIEPSDIGQLQLDVARLVVERLHRYK